MRMAKTRESLRSIKAVDKAEGLAKKSKNGTSSLANAAEETQNSRHETEVEYAGNEVQDKEERSGRKRKELSSRCCPFRSMGVSYYGAKYPKMEKPPAKNRAEGGRAKAITSTPTTDAY